MTASRPANILSLKASIYLQEQLPNQMNIAIKAACVIWNKHGNLDP